MTSYIQLISKIQAFCDAHKQIERFNAEFGEQRPNLATESEKYPYVFMSPSSATPNYDLNTVTVTITCYDIIQKDRANLNTIVSDCHLIVTDLYGYYNQGIDEEVIALSATQTPVNNYDLDYVAGWSMDIVFELEGWCTDAIPIDPIVTPDPSCEDANYNITDDSANVLYSGTIASGSTLNQTIQDSTAALKDSGGVTISTTSINAEASADITAPDATVENSDASYSTTVKSNDSLTLPDSELKVNGTPEGNVVSVKTTEINIEDSSGTVTPDSVTLVGNTATIVVPTGGSVGAELIKTGQTTSYRTGDDGDIEAGRASDFLTLASNNPFGNTNRFTDELGGQTYTNDIVIDWSTYDGSEVLGYYRTLSPTGSWNSTIDWCVALSVGTFTSGWRLTNRNELENIANWGSGLTNCFSYAPFNNSVTIHWSSTTSRSVTTNAYYINSTNGNMVEVAKTVASLRSYSCRNFTNAELGI